MNLFSLVTKSIFGMVDRCPSKLDTLLGVDQGKKTQSRKQFFWKREAEMNLFSLVTKSIFGMVCLHVLWYVSFITFAG